MHYTLPKKYLSYSAITLWNKNKEQFRSKYYLGEEGPITPYMLFGKEIAALLEQDDMSLRHIPRYKYPEHEIKVMVKGIPVIGYLDSFSKQLKTFIEYKTGILSPTGEVPWNDAKVAKHDQLPFYSYLIKKKYGKVTCKCRLVWLETRWKTETQVFDGHELSGDSKQLELTGYKKVFTRTIREWERNRIEDMIIKAAEEISKDYEEYRRLQNRL